MPSFVAMPCRGLDGGLTNQKGSTLELGTFLEGAGALRHFKAKDNDILRLFSKDN